MLPAPSCRTCGGFVECAPSPEMLVQGSVFGCQVVDYLAGNPVLSRQVADRVMGIAKLPLRGLVLLN